MFAKTISFFILYSFLYISKATVLNMNDSLRETSVKYDSIHGLVRKTEEKIRKDVKLIDDNLEPEAGISKYTDNNYATNSLFENKKDGEINEGSGDENLENAIIIETDEKSDIENFNTVNKTTLLKEFETETTEAVTDKFAKEKTSSQVTDEGSADGITQYTAEYLITKIAVKTTAKPTEVYEPIPEVCLLSECSFDDVYAVISEDARFIPEGKNLTLTCISNSSDYNMLYWYKSNGSIYNLEAFGTEQQLHLNIPNIKTIHSGMYKCVKWISKESCCNTESHLIIYEVPPYHYHLLIIGLVAAAFFITCIFLVIRQSMSFKVYSKQFTKKHESVKQQLL